MRRGMQCVRSDKQVANSQITPSSTCFHAMLHLRRNIGTKRRTGPAQPPVSVRACPPAHPPLVHAQLVDDVGHHNVVLRHHLKQHLRNRRGAGAGGAQGSEEGLVGLLPTLG